MALSLGMVIALIKKFGGGGGAVDDVQVNGTSVLSQGVANIPEAGDSTYGVVKYSTTGGGGLKRLANTNEMAVDLATDSQIKAGGHRYHPIVPSNQHNAAFYGFAKAAGDSTQSESANNVGTYTADAKSAISVMLNAPETVSGTTPIITGKAGVRYICGEVTTISITPPVSGAVDVIFESGSTPAVLTVPNTVKFPAWFDPDDLDANVTYEINILDGVYGVVTSWA